MAREIVPRATQDQKYSFGLSSRLSVIIGRTRHFPMCRGLAALFGGSQMKRVLLVAVVTACAASAATVPCSGGSDVLTTGFSCTVGGLTFSNFKVVPAAGGDAVTPRMTLVDAAIDTTHNEAVLSFNPHMAAFASSMPAFQDLWFYFTVSGGVTGVDLTVGGMNAAIGETACSSAIDTAHGNICTGGLANQLAALTAQSGQSVLYSNPFPSTSPINLFKDISIASTATRNAALTSFQQSFVLPPGFGTLIGGAAVVVPEPSSLLTLGAALLGGAFFLKRFRRT